MNSPRLVKNLPQAFAIVKASKRRGFVRVCRVEVVQIYEQLSCAGVQEIATNTPHYLPFARLVQVARRDELPVKLRVAIAEERAARERQTEMFRPSGMLSEDLKSTPDEKSAVTQTMAGAGVE